MFDQLTLDTTSIIVWIAFGIVAGMVAHAIDSGAVKGGIMGTIIASTIGAFIGGLVSPALLGSPVTGFYLPTLLIAIGGALLAAFIYRLLFRETSHIKTTHTSMSKGGKSHGQRE